MVKGPCLLRSIVTPGLVIFHLIHLSLAGSETTALVGCALERRQVACMRAGDLVRLHLSNLYVRQ